MWNCSSPSPVLQYTFECNQGAVLSIAVRGETIYAGCQDGYIKVLDLETRTLVRTVIVREVNSRALRTDGFLTDPVERRGSFPLYVALRPLQRVSKRPDSGGRKVVGAELFLKYHQRWSASFDCTAESDGHTDSIILSSVVTYSEESGQFQLVTGANDGYIKVCARDSSSRSALTALRSGISNFLNQETTWMVVFSARWLSAELKAQMVGGMTHPRQILSDIVFSSRHHALRPLEIHLDP